MMWLGVLIGALSLSLAFGSPQGNRTEGSNLIFGGEGPLEKPFPPLVQLFDSKGAFCGGTLLTNSYVLTAAHCFQSVKSDEVTVYAGLAYLGDTENINVQSSKVAHVILHPLWDNKPANDIAIVVLVNNITYTEKIQPIKIFAFESEYPPEVDNKLLYKANTNIVRRHDCAALWKNMTNPVTITTEQICTNAKGKGTLPGDSGGPVIYFYHNLLTNQIEPRQVGIISFLDEDDSKYPDVHTRASSYCTWITQETKLAYWCS